MNSWKEGVANKLSRLLSDTPTSPPLHDVHCSRSFLTPLSQELSFPGDSISSQKRSTFSSIFLSLVPASCSGAGQSASSSPQDPRLSPSQSHSKSWKSSSFGFKDRPLESATKGEPESYNDFTAALVTENANNVTERSVNATVSTQGLPSSNDSTKLIPNLMEKSTFVSEDLFEFLHSCLPNIVKGCQWALLYRAVP